MERYKLHHYSIIKYIVFKRNVYAKLLINFLF